MKETKSIQNTALLWIITNWKELWNPENMACNMHGVFLKGARVTP
jgi:hypothetical protein